MTIISVKEIFSEGSNTKKVFLGGTTNESTWREDLIPMLNIDYFNPVVDDWTPEDQENEIRERKSCDFCLYVITPKMLGVYSIAEVVDDSNKRPDKTIFCFLTKDGKNVFEKKQIMSLEQVAKMVSKNGATVAKDLKEVSEIINSRK